MSELLASTDMRRVAFKIECNPADLPTAQQKGVRIIKVHGKQMPMFYEKPAIKKAHLLLKALLAPHVPKQKMTGPIFLRVKYHYPWPKGTPKCRSECFAPMVQRPDVDNVQKLVQDAMTECGFWEDDSQIWKLELEKMRTPIEPCISFEIIQSGSIPNE